MCSSDLHQRPGASRSTLLRAAAASTTSLVPGDYENQLQMLNQDGSPAGYFFYWTVAGYTGSPSDTLRLDALVLANTTGWVGWGLSPDGTMTNADIVIAWVPPSFHAASIIRQSNPIINPIINPIQSSIQSSTQSSIPVVIFACYPARARSVSPPPSRSPRDDQQELLVDLDLHHHVICSATCTECSVYRG